MSENATKSGSFWRTLPGFLTAIGGVITALATLVAALSAAGFFHSKPPSSPTPAQVVSASDGKNRTSSSPLSLVLPVRINGSGGLLMHGFFASRGNIITMATESISVGARVAVTWREQGEERKALAQVTGAGAFTPEVILLTLKPEDSPNIILPIRLSKTLQVNEKVERYLGEHDRAPGRILQLGVEQLIWRTKVQDLIVTSSISGAGDGGAPVLDLEKKVVGMIYGSSKTETFSIPIEKIKLSFPQAF